MNPVPLAEPRGTSAPLAIRSTATNPPAPGTAGASAGDSGGESGSRGEESPSRSPIPRLLICIVLFAFVAIGGAYFASHPAPTPIDRLAERILPVEWSVRWLAFFTNLGRPRVVIPGVVVCCVMAFLWDRRRAITCLAAPAAAIGITEYLAKPIVGRTYGGSLSYPSGHMTSVAVLVAVFVLAVPPRFRWPAAIFGTAVDLWLGATLILLRWHYLTDVLAGAAVAIGTTLLVDTVVHMYPGWRLVLRPAHPARGSGRRAHQIR